MDKFAQHYELQEKIDNLTSLLEAELKRLKSNHAAELEQIKIHFSKAIASLNKNLSNERNEFYQKHLHKVSDLEEKIQYLKELTASQRLMMEDYVKHIKSLEKRLHS